MIVSGKKAVVKVSEEAREPGQLNLLLLGKKNSSVSRVYALNQQLDNPLRSQFSKLVKGYKQKHNWVSTAAFDEIFSGRMEEFFNPDNTFKFFITETQLREVMDVPEKHCDDLYKLGFIIGDTFLYSLAKRAHSVAKCYGIHTDVAFEELVPFHSPRTGEYVIYKQTGVVTQWEDISKRGKRGYYKYEGRWKHWKEISEETGWSRRWVGVKCSGYNRE